MNGHPTQDFVEAIVIVHSDSVKPEVASWFHGRDFQALPMRAGFLITGSAATFGEVFHTAIQGRSRDQELPAPEDIRHAVDRITIRQTPDYREQ